MLTRLTLSKHQTINTQLKKTRLIKLPSINYYGLIQWWHVKSYYNYISFILSIKLKLQNKHKTSTITCNW